MCSASPLCHQSSSCGTQGCTKPWSAGPSWGLPRVCGAQPSPCPACTAGQPELFSSKQAHVCAGAAWLGAAFCQGCLAHPAVLQLQLAWQLVLPARGQKAGSSRSLGSWGGTAWGHAQLCECLGREHPPPGRAGEPREPPTSWPHWFPTASKATFGKGCSSACSLPLWVGSSAEGAELFSLPEVS